MSHDSKTQTMNREIDMSPSAVARRIETLRQLYRLGMSLVQAGQAAGLNNGLGRPLKLRARDVERDGG